MIQAAQPPLSTENAAAAMLKLWVAAVWLKVVWEWRRRLRCRLLWQGTVELVARPLQAEPVIEH